MKGRPWNEAGITAVLGVLLIAVAAAVTDPAAAGMNASGEAVEVITVDEAVAMALEGNPGLAEVQARARAAAAIPSQEGALPDPSIGFNALNLPVDTFDLNQEPMTQLQLAVSQSLPFPGKLSLKEEAARFDAEAMADGVDEARLQLVREVRAAWWRLFFLDRSLEIVERNLDLLKEFVEIARVKYTVGEGLQQDVLLAQVELSQLKDRRIVLRASRRVQAATLNALLDREAGRAVRLPGTTDADLPAVLDEETLFERADRFRPLLARRENELRAAGKRVDFAERDRLPDFTVGAGYGFRGGENPDGSSRPDFLSLRLGVTVPLYSASKQARAVDQRSSERLARRYALQDERGKVRAAIESALAGYEESLARSKLYETGVIPQARLTVQSMLAGYRVNKVDFLNLVRAQITLYNHETRYWEALTSAWRSLADLAASVGAEVAR